MRLKTVELRPLQGRLFKAWRVYGVLHEKPGMSDREEKLLVDVHEVARLLSISTRAVFKWVEQGKLPKPLKIGRCCRWRKSELVAWVERGCPRVSEK